MLTIDEVWGGYGGSDVLRGVSFDVARQQTLCIVGANGAGKSTVLKTISGLLRPRRGRVVVDGRDMTGLPPTEILRSGVVQVPQHSSLFPKMSVRENVMLGGYLLRRDKALLEDRYARVADTFPIVGDRSAQLAANLSGGQRRSVELARAFMLAPQLLLLDEPSVGLDPRSLGDVADTIDRVRGADVAVVLVEQNVRFGLALADTAVVLAQGRVTLQGPCQDLLEDPHTAQVLMGTAVPDAGDLPRAAG